MGYYDDLACGWCAQAITYNYRGTVPSFCGANCRMASHRDKTKRRRQLWEADLKVWSDIMVELDRAERSLNACWPLCSGVRRSEVKDLWSRTNQQASDWKRHRPIESAGERARGLRLFAG